MDVFKYYCHDLGYLIREMALEAKQDHVSNGTDFTAGYMAGFRRVVSLMQQQCVGFGVPLEEIRLDGIDPDQDLV